MIMHPEYHEITFVISTKNSNEIVDFQNAMKQFESKRLSLN